MTISAHFRPITIVSLLDCVQFSPRHVALLVVALGELFQPDVVMSQVRLELVKVGVNGALVESVERAKVLSVVSHRA